MTPPREIVLCHYGYDPLDRLNSHALPDFPECQRFYCKSRLVTEIQGSMRHSIVQHGDQLLAQHRSEGDAAVTTLLTTDPQRSVLQTLKATHLPQPIAYSPYGHRSVESELLPPLGFNGERRDPVTGHYLLGNGYRAFNPVLMRFNSPDSWSPFGKGGLNSYAYCNGDPVNFTDPTGHWIFSWFAKQLGLKKSSHLNLYLNHRSYHSVNDLNPRDFLETKKGVTARRGKIENAKLNKLGDEIESRTEEIVAGVYYKDRAIAQSASDYNVRPANQLETAAYKAIHRPSQILNSTTATANQFENPYSTLIERGILREQASYMSLFNRVGIDKQMLLNNFRFSRHELTASYRLRLDAAVDANLEISALTTEFNRIRGKYFRN